MRGLPGHFIHGCRLSLPCARQSLARVVAEEIAELVSGAALCCLIPGVRRAGGTRFAAVLAALTVATCAG